MAKYSVFCFFFQAEDGIRDGRVTGVQTCALPILVADRPPALAGPYHGDDESGHERGHHREHQHLIPDAVEVELAQPARDRLLPDGQRQSPSRSTARFTFRYPPATVSPLTV